MITYQQEFLNQVKDEALPLIKSQFDEVYPSRDYVTLDMDWDLYQKLEEMQLLKIFTARSNGSLVGYLWVIVSPNIHSKGSYTATDDAWFVSKEYRKSGTAVGLLRFTEKCLKEDGFKSFYISGTEDVPLDKLMSKLGYNKIETKFERVFS